MTWNFFSDCIKKPLKGFTLKRVRYIPIYIDSNFFFFFFLFDSNFCHCEDAINLSTGEMMATELK